MTLDLEKIKKVIPHRDPFLLIDEIVELETMDYAIGIKQIKDTEYYFKGHFPNKPVVPGVIIIESLAQVGAVVILSSKKFLGKIAYFTGIKQAKFRKSVLPGDKLILKCTITKIKGVFGFGRGEAYVGDDLVCEADISFAIGV